LLGLVDADAFDAAGVDPTSRAEELDVVAWGRLAAAAGLPAGADAAAGADAVAPPVGLGPADAAEGPGDQS
jgi:hypothetical protein